MKLYYKLERKLIETYSEEFVYLPLGVGCSDGVLSFTNNALRWLALAFLGSRTMQLWIHFLAVLLLLSQCLVVGGSLCEYCMIRREAPLSWHSIKNVSLFRTWTITQFLLLSMKGNVKAMTATL